MMKATFFLCAMLPMVSPFMGAQAPTPQPAPPAVAPPVVAAPDLSKLGDYQKACEQEAIHKPAYEYCSRFAVLLAGMDNPVHTASLAIANLTPDVGSLANAYSIYKANLIVNLADQKAAVNNGQTKQVGSAAGNSGSTSLVGKAAVTNLISVAIESGALTQGQTGNTITLQTDPASLFREAYLGTPQLSYLPVSSPFLENFTVSAGLAVNANSTTSVPTTGSATSSTVDTTSLLLNSSATKLSSLSVNYEFRKMTQDRVKRYLIKKGLKYLSVDTDAASQAADKDGVAFSVYFVGVTPAGCDAPSYDTIASSAAPVAQRIDQFIVKFDDCFTKASETAAAAAKTAGKDLDTEESAYNAALLADIASFQKKVKDQISGWDLAAQYVFNKPVGQPETHDLRLIGSGDIKKSQGAAWTVNAAASIYETLPSGAQYGRLKDAQFSGELDKSWGSGSSAPVIGLAGYGQYQSKPTVLNISASNVPAGVTLPANAQAFLSGTQGWLGVIQCKTTVRVGTAQIPVAVKWSNKPDLLGKSKLGAQFGVSYDFSQLKQLIGKGSPSN